MLLFSAGLGGDNSPWEAGQCWGDRSGPGGFQAGWEPSESGSASRRPPPLPSSSPFECI